MQDDSSDLIIAIWPTQTLVATQILVKFGTLPSNTVSRKLILLLTKYLQLLMTIMVETVLWHPEVPLLLLLALNHKTEEGLNGTH